MNSIILRKNSKPLPMEIPGEFIRVKSPDVLLARLRDTDFMNIIICVESGEKLSMNLLKGVYQRSPLSAIFVFAYERPNLTWHEGLYIDKIFPLPPDKDEVEEFHEMLEIKKILSASDIAGKSSSLYSIGKVIMRVAKTDLAVLITGESGVGKEIVARSIHSNSPRNDVEFLPVNSGAIPEGLIEAELFGHTKGAFTGASGSREGYFKQADKGTIFLDEIGELPERAQVKLLRILESGEYFPVGSSRKLHVDVRVIAATNRNIKQAVKKGEFREDLYYRLGVVNIYIPPLRERPEDILVLTNFFKDQLEKKYSRSFAGFTDNAIDGLLSYHFPGNVRELRNLIENSLLLGGNQKVTLDDLKTYFETHSDLGKSLPSRIENEKPDQADMMRILGYIASELNDIKLNLESLNDKFEQQGNPINKEKQKIEQALETTNGNKTEAAKLLGMSRKTLYRKLDQMDIEA